MRNYFTIFQDEMAMIIDAHAHIFPQVHGMIASGPTRGTGYGRITAGPETMQLIPPYGLQTIFTPEMLIANLDWAGVGKAVLLQGPFYGECNQYVLDALHQYPDRLAGLAYLDPWDKGAHSMLEWVIETQAFRGIKLECSEATGLTGLHPEARLDMPEISWVWTEIEERGMVLVLDLGKPGSRSYQTPAVRAIAEDHPGMKVVIAHLGQPGPEIEAAPALWRLWQEQIELGRLPNVWFDCAALPAYLPGEDFPFPSAGRYLRLAIERIGAAKVMWGSDQPGLLSHADLPHLAKMVRQQTGFLSPHDQTLVLGGNAAYVFNLKG
jgi:predicted TIM-barrel fold metal-dependent hydrolase